MHGGYKYVVKVVEGEACIDQGNRLVLFLIGCGNPPVRTLMSSTRTPDLVHKEEKERKKTES